MNDMQFSIGDVYRKDAEHAAVLTFDQTDICSHTHQFFELVYIMGGTGKQILNNNTQMVSEGDFYLIDIGASHSYDECNDFSLVNCLFMPEIIDQTMVGCKSFDELMKMTLMHYYKIYYGHQAVNRIFHDANGEIRALILAIRDEFENKKLGYMEIFTCKLREILMLMVRRVLDESGVLQNISVNYSEAVRGAMDYFDRNYVRKSVLTLYCREAHYSNAYICRRFREETGITGMEYIQRLRLEKSCRLLAENEIPVSEIASRVGYEDYRFWAKLFTRVMGTSPINYRKMTLYK